MKKYLFALAFLLSFSIVNWSWQSNLLEDLDWCSVEQVTRHNSFVKINMTCNYYDGVIIGKIRETLYVSSVGYVIKAGRK